MLFPGSFNFRPKKKKQPVIRGWELTLADMMTLLLCFFVIMLSVAKVDQKQYEAVADVMAEAMQGKAAPSKRNAQEMRMSVEPKTRNLFELQLELAKLIGRETRAVKLKLRPDTVAIELRGGIFFKLGSADLTPDALRILDKLARPLTEAHYKLTMRALRQSAHSLRTIPVQLELHQPAHHPWPGTYRAGPPAKDIQVMGLADTRPLAPNMDKDGKDIPANQAKNRRIVILVRPIS